MSHARINNKTMRQPFLEELAEDLLSRFGADAGSLSVVFPNRRAGLFFRKYLSSKISTPLWAPEIHSIDDFILQFSDLQLADRITLVFELYEVYREILNSDEDFDRFYYWGEALLNDFDEIDKYMVDADLLFRDLSMQKEIELQYEYLSDEQREAVISFWSSFRTRLSRHQEDFLKIWKALFGIYQQFRINLESKGIAYPGMVYRQVAESPQKFIRLKPGEHIIFAGLNALTTAEETIIRKLAADGKGEMAWDMDAYYVDNPIHEAGSFLRKYRRDPVFSTTFTEPIPKLIAENFERKINVFGVGSKVGQAKKAAEIIEELASKGDWDPQKTAVILPDESMLFPTMNSLPENVDRINITMGYPLKDTPAYHFAESLVELHINSRKKDEEIQFYHPDLSNIARHAWFARFNPEEARIILRLIEERNLIYIPSNDCPRGLNYPNIFGEIASHSELLDLIIRTFTYLESQNIPDVEKEYLLHLKKHLTRLKELTAGRESQITLRTLQRLFRQSSASVKIPFTGEPLDGLQVMGALEARNLDFQHIFILSFNEGSYPRSGGLHSFLPFNLRKGYGLPTFDYQDSIYSYNFFRLLQRSETVYLFYNTAGENGGGEMSRFLYQLIYESKFDMRHSIVNGNVNIESSELPVIEKSVLVMEKIDRYLDPESGYALAPSAINIYLDCRMRFYFRYVADLYEPDDVKEEIDPVIFGNLLHRAMEYLYKEFEQSGKEVTPNEAALLKSKLEEAVGEAFNAEFGGKPGKKYETVGRNAIIAEIINKMAQRIIESDETYAPFKILSLEGGAEKKRFRGSIQIQLPSGQRRHVAVKGIVDRIDRKNDTIRIIDYKTGKDDKSIESIDSLLDRDHPKRNKAAMQTFLYSLIYRQKHGITGSRIMPGIFNIRELFAKNFDYRLQLKSEQGSNYEPVNDVTPFLTAFEDRLQIILQEIFDPSIAFDHTEDKRKCIYCAYRRICGL